MPRFLVNTPDKRETKEAYEELLAIEEGNRLTICTGYIWGEKGALEQKHLLNWLRAKTDRHLLLIFGYWGKYQSLKKSIPDESEIVVLQGKRLAFQPGERERAKFMKRTSTIFDPYVFPEYLADRVFILGVRNFHAKAIRLSSVMPTGEKRILAGFMGSSNFTNAALYKPFQFEMDFFMRAGQGSDDLLLEKFSEDLDRLMSAAMPLAAEKAVAEFERKTWLPALRAIEDDEFDDFLAQEEEAFRQHAHKLEERAMADSYRESDRALGIAGSEEQ